MDNLAARPSPSLIAAMVVAFGATISKGIDLLSATWVRNNLIPSLTLSPRWFRTASASLLSSGEMRERTTSVARVFIDSFLAFTPAWLD